MARKTVELRAVIKCPEGGELVQTGIYVFEDSTLKSVRELMKDGIQIGSKRYEVAYVEFDMKDKEEE